MNQTLPLFSKITGKGKPVLFLHGFLEDHTIWNSIYPEFVNTGFQCILVDLPCHGQSRFEGEICQMNDMATAVLNLLKNHKIEDPFVFGHSMGGYVGLELLRLMPLKLTLVHSNFWADAESKKQDRNRVIEIIKKNKSLFLNESIPNLFAPVNREFRREEIQNLISAASKVPTAEIIAATAGMRDRKSSYDLFETHAINLIQGSDDPIIPTGILEHELMKLAHQPKIYRISECGHMGFIEQPGQLINHMRTILFE